jgi:hypothetical protein
MSCLFPKIFGLRGALLSTFAAALAILFAYLTKDAGLGAFGAMIIFTIFGTAVFIGISGGDRLFYTALFTTLYMTFLFAVILYRHFFPVVGDENDIGGIVVLGLACYGLFVALPVGFVWIAPKILKYARRDA